MFRCPSPTDILNATFALLPRGRAWQNHEGAPAAGSEVGFNPQAFNRDAFSTYASRQSVLYQFWAAVAEAFIFLNQRICDLRREFWCASIVETRDLWMEEYGLPDACDPFPELCAKVAAIGGTRCEYYTYIAERAGWRIQCLDGVNVCGARPGSGRARAGRATPGRPHAAGQLFIVVDIPNSPAISTTFRDKLPRAGRLKARQRLTCAVDIATDFAPLDCLLARIVHAEILITYEAMI